MKRSLALIVPALAAIALTACARSDGIDEDGTKFAGIAPSETITLGGTEPFWSLRIAPASEGHSAQFSTPGEEIDPTAFPMERLAGNNGLGFSGELGEQRVQVAITPGECSDGMSDRTYPYSATVALGETKLLGCAHTDSQPFTGPAEP